MAPRRQETPPAATPSMPTWQGTTDGEIATRADGTRWQWHASSGVAGLGGAYWEPLAPTAADTPSAPVAGVPSDAGAATPPATGDANATGTSTGLPATAPAGMSDEQLDAWYQQQMQVAADAMSKLQGQIDTAVTDLDTAQAAMDVAAIQTARTKLQAFQNAYTTASNRQNDYATQQGKIRDRAAKTEAAKDARTMTPEQQAEHEARLQGYQSEADARAAQIAENNANRDLTEKRIAWEQAKALRDDDPAKRQADLEYSQAQTRASDATTAYNTAQTAALKQKTAIEQQYGAAQAGANVRSTEAAASASEEQTKAYALERQVNAEKLRKEQEGAGVTLHRQLEEWIAAAPDDATAAQREADADAEWTRYKSGGSQLDWQTKLNDTAVTLTDNLAARGMLTSGRGLDPTGAIGKALGNVGIPWQDTTQGGTPLAAFAQQAGVNLHAPQYTVSGAPPQSATGAVPGWAQPQQAAAAGVVDARHLSTDQLVALAEQATGQSHSQPPTAGAGLPTSADSFTFSPAVQQPAVIHGGGAVPGPIHAARGGVYAVPGWALAGRR